MRMEVGVGGFSGPFRSHFRQDIFSAGLGHGGKSQIQPLRHWGGAV